VFEPIAVTLIASAVGGLSVLAYNRPRVYAKIDKILWYVLQGSFLVAAFWNGVSDYTYHVLTPFIDLGQLDNAREVIEGMQIPWLRLMAVYLVINLYCAFLTYLSRLVQEDKDK
jgi:hypothetical protein